MIGAWKVDIKQITDVTEKSISEDMESAINAEQQWEAEMYFNWAVGSLNLWRRLASATISQNSDIPEWLELNKYRDIAEKKKKKLVSTDRIPLLRIEE